MIASLAQDQGAGLTSLRYAHAPRREPAVTRRTHNCIRSPGSVDP